MAFFQSKHVWGKQLGEGVAVLVIDRTDGVLNTFDPALLDDLEKALDAVSHGFRLLIIRSGKSESFGQGPAPALLASWQREDFVAWCERGQRLCSRLAGMPMPSVCVISGACLDAGLELALACDHRVVVDAPSTSLGFADLEWGMIPCWGGTQRLPHVIGLDRSLYLLLASEQFDARKAWACNLADDLVESAGDEPPPSLADPVKRDWTRFPCTSWRQRWLESNRLGRWLLFRGAERVVRTRIPEEMPAPRIMLEALRHAYQAPSVEAGLDFERDAIERVADHPALHHLLRLMLHREHLRLPSIRNSDKTRIREVGVIGTGMASLSLYLQCIAHGYKVVLRAPTKEALALGMLQVNQLLELEVQRGNMTEQEYGKVMGGFRGTYTWTHFDRLHLILDTSDADLDTKRRFYQDMEREAAKGVLIVPVSSRHRIVDLQQAMQLPHRLIGLHLIEPWNLGSPAEIVTPAPAGQVGAQRLRDWLVDLGKCCLQVPDCPGGLTMRIWMPALNEAGLLIREGVPIDRIDHAMRRFGMAYGPCEWMDRIGIDQVAMLVDAMRPLFAGRINLESGFAQMVSKGWLGNLSGLGFYQPGLRNLKPHGDAVRLWESQSQGETALPVPVLSYADRDAWIQMRLVTLMLLEAIRCYQEGMVKDTDDLDCVMCLTGWASHRGGPFGYARQLGAAALMQRCEELARVYGARFTPPASLADALG